MLPSKINSENVFIIFFNYKHKSISLYFAVRGFRFLLSFPPSLRVGFEERTQNAIFILQIHELIDSVHLLCHCMKLKMNNKTSKRS